MSQSNIFLNFKMQMFPQQKAYETLGVRLYFEENT